MEPVFQVRTLRLWDLLKLTQVKSCGAKAQTQGICLPVLCISPLHLVWGEH